MTSVRSALVKKLDTAELAEAWLDNLRCVARAAGYHRAEAPDFGEVDMVRLWEAVARSREMERHHLACAVWNADDAAFWRKAYEDERLLRDRERKDVAHRIAVAWLTGPAQGDESSGTYRWLLEQAER